jgi:hypothetical protein
MTAFDNVMKHSLQTGAVASTTTALTTAVLGATEIQNVVAPINAVSHIAWGDGAVAQDEPSVKYTLTGLALNTAAVTGWAAVHELLFGHYLKRGNLPAALLGGAATSALAFVTDYYVVPRRFTPGFERRLSGGSLLGIYSVLAVSLAFGRACFRDR